MTIRARIFLVFILAMITGFGVLGHWINDAVKVFHNQSYEELLVDIANVFAELVAQDLHSDKQQPKKVQMAFDKARARKFSAQIYDVVKQNFDLRVYVTDAQGKVIYDSSGIAALDEDYSNWRDVKLTLQGKYGARTSDESVLDSDGNKKSVSVSYVAAPVISDGVIVGVISVGKPKTNIDKFVERARYDAVITIILSVLFALFVALMLYLWVSKPLKAIVNYAEQVMRGERADPPLNGGREIRQVGQAMANMRTALEDKQYVERYVQTLTHEIKSPLTAIMTAAELLNGELPKDKHQLFITNIIVETQRLDDFANRLLQLAAVEKLNQLTVRSDVNIPSLLIKLEQSLKPILQKKNLVLEIQQKTNVKVWGDAFLLQQAIENLLRNAIDFSPEGSLIKVTVHGDEQTCVIEICDEGIGISDYALPHIFERFYSLPRPSGKKSTGLGLNFVKEVAELHNGQIILANCSPKGVKAQLHINNTIST